MAKRKAPTGLEFWWRLGAGVAIIAGGIAYVMFPLDVLPDAAIPVIGYMDDAAVLAFSAWSIRYAWKDIQTDLKRIFG
jgi:uncharacterized membrane protein YkvA (DUF1232 family)